MIVVDTNIVAYALIDGPRTRLAREAFRRDPEWRLPHLWRHEFLNILATYARSGGANPDQMLSVWRQAEAALARFEHPVNMPLALELAVAHAISAYDAQFIALAQSLDVRCLTDDRELVRKFPRTAISLELFCR